MKDSAILCGLIESRFYCIGWPEDIRLLSPTILCLVAYPFTLRWALLSCLLAIVSTILT